MSKDIKVKATLDDQISPKVKKMSDKVKGNLNDIEKGSNKLTGSFKKLGGAIGAGLAVRALVQFGAESIKLARVQIEAEAKLEQTIKATGGAAGLTATQLKGMASQLQSVTTFGDEAVIGAQALLLTFKNIGGDVFPRVTEAVLDMSVAMGTGLKESSIQLGKALNDPVQGISALTRVGIQFTDVQKSQIKTFTEANDLASAQAVILKEVESQFGGVARAMAETDVGKIDQLTNSINDLKEEIGTELIPLQKTFLSLINETIIGWKDLLGVGERSRNEDVLEEIESSTALMKVNQKLIAEYEGVNVSQGRARTITRASREEYIQAKQNVIDLTAELKKLAGTPLGGGATGGAGGATGGAGGATGGGGGGGGGGVISAKPKGKSTETFYTLGVESSQALAEGFAIGAEQRQSKQDEIDQMRINREAEILQAMADLRGQASEVGLTEQEIERERLETWYDEKLELVRGNKEAEADLNAVYREQQIELDKKAANDEMKLQHLKLGVASDVAGGFSALLKVAGKENKAAANAAKALAITQVTIDTFIGAQKSYNALASIVPVGPVLGAVAAAGAIAFGLANVAQIAQQSFATGGIVGGSSFNGDNVPINVNSGEVVLNKAQQLNLMAMANGGAGRSGGNSISVTVNGNADETTTQDMIEQLTELISDKEYAGQ